MIIYLFFNSYNLIINSNDKLKSVGVVKKILVYDNQNAYYELLKNSITEEYEFISASTVGFEFADSECDMVLFFLYDEIELLDFVKLYNENIPFVLGIANEETAKDIVTEGNIQFLNLNNLKDELLADVKVILKTVQPKKKEPRF
ncbi:hypothetical protein ACX0HA_04250 [Flavobacterium hauense]